jgi:nitrate reductase delta subunit
MMYGALADLLDYPRAGLPSCAAAYAETVDGAAEEELRTFAETLRGLSQGEMEELYTRTFDLQLESCLYVGHHLFGEDWRRGLFMARLKHRYDERGFSGGSECPDWLPAVLRFLDAEPHGPDTEELLQECVIPAAARLLRVLEGKSNPYAAVLRALLRYLAPEGIHRLETENLSCRPSSSSLFRILP